MNLNLEIVSNAVKPNEEQSNQIRFFLEKDVFELFEDFFNPATTREQRNIIWDIINWREILAKRYGTILTETDKEIVAKNKKLPLGAFLKNRENVGEYDAILYSRIKLAISNFIKLPHFLSMADTASSPKNLNKNQFVFRNWENRTYNEINAIKQGLFRLATTERYDFVDKEFTMKQYMAFIDDDTDRYKSNLQKYKEEIALEKSIYKKIEEILEEKDIYEVIRYFGQPDKFTWDNFRIIHNFFTHINLKIQMWENASENRNPELDYYSPFSHPYKYNPDEHLHALQMFKNLYKDLGGDDFFANFSFEEAKDKTFLQKWNKILERVIKEYKDFLKKEQFCDITEFIQETK